MQSAHVKGWTREAHLPAAMLESLRELNHRFLDLICLEADQWRSSVRMVLPAELCAQIAPLSAAQKKAAAGCPYALFELRFHDDEYWRTRLKNSSAWAVADDAALDQNMLNFVRLALFFAWHVAASGKLAPSLLLGMSDATAAAFRGVTIDCLPALVATEAPNLTARWGGSSIYWRALAGAASRPNCSELRRIQLYGLQLAAAARLESGR
jgi:hypothetical protein